MITISRCLGLLCRPLLAQGELVPWLVDFDSHCCPRGDYSCPLQRSEEVVYVVGTQVEFGAVAAFENPGG